MYTAQSPPYRTGNWPMTSPSELMNLPGFGADRYRKIAPYVTALPSATAPDQHLHRARDRARESRRQSERRVFPRSGAAHQRTRKRLFSRCPDIHQHPGTQRGQAGQTVFGHELVFPTHHPRNAWHYAVHLVQSFVAERQRRQGDAAAAHIRNTLGHMPHTLLLRLPAAGQEDTEWLSIDETGQATTAKQRGPLSLAAAVARSAKVVALAPATQILLAEPELPPGSGVKLARAVPFALEEQLTEDIDELCFALGPRSAGGRTPVAVVSRTVLQGWSRQLGDAGIEPAAIYADISLIPENPGQTVLWLEGSRLAVRRPGVSAVRGGAHAGLRGVGRSPASYPIRSINRARARNRSHWRARCCMRLARTGRESRRSSTRSPDKFASLKVQLLPEGPLPWLARNLGDHRCGQSAAGRVRAQHGLRRALAPMANRRAARGRVAGDARRRPRHCRFIRPTARRPPSTGRSRRSSRRRCPPRACRIRAARCSRASSAFAAPERDRNISCAAWRP